MPRQKQSLGVVDRKEQQGAAAPGTVKTTFHAWLPPVKLRKWIRGNCGIGANRYRGAMTGFEGARAFAAQDRS
jgi:hypothetical protein